MTYEDLLTDADHAGLLVKEQNLLEYDGLIKGDRIAIRETIPTQVAKACVLAEELGHHYTSSGIIIDQTSTSNRKQERRARIWAYKKAFELTDLILAFKVGCRNRYEFAEYLEITESFLQEAIDYYKEKYGPYIIQEPYVIYLDPLGVLELLRKE